MLEMFTSENWIWALILSLIIIYIIYRTIKDISIIRAGKKEIKMMDKMIKASEERIERLGKDMAQNNKILEESFTNLETMLKKETEGKAEPKEPMAKQTAKKNLKKKPNEPKKK